MSGPQLHVYTDDHDTVVAYDMADAEKVWEEHVGQTYERACDNKFDECWSQVSDDKAITIRDDEDNSRETKTAKEWAESNGRGFLCSTDY